MITEDAMRTLLQTAVEQRPPHPAPVDELIHAGRRAKSRRHGWMIATVVAAAALAGSGNLVATNVLTADGPPPAGHPHPTANHAGLTNREFSIAVRIAHQQARRVSGTVTRAIATVGEGTVIDSNIGHPCTSGTLLHITLIGRFNVAVSPPPGVNPGPVTQVGITADPVTGRPCLMGVSTGKVTPDPKATVLFHS